MPSSSLFLRSSTTLVSVLSLLSVPAFAAPVADVYNLDTSYSGTNFFDGWNFYDQADPTHGFVTYLNRGDAQTAGLISAGRTAQMRVDTTTKLKVPSGVGDYWGKNGVGRKSVRIESSLSWTQGLFIVDLNHMPTSAPSGCGTWPAFWALGSGPWPGNGEVDIIEGANDQTKNTVAGHVANQCSVNNNGGSGSLLYSNCNYNAPDPFGNSLNPTGCQVADRDSASWGAAFNRIGGGAYAMEWTSDAIKVWFFRRGATPSDINSANPNPANWGSPSTIISVSGGCNIDRNFKDMRLVFDTTFCGDFGDATWGNGCAASTKTSKCDAFVAQNPAAFQEAYWDVNYVKIYKKGAPKTTTTSSTTTTVRTTTSSLATTTTTTSSRIPTTTASTTPSTTSSAVPTTTSTTSSMVPTTTASTTPSTTSSSAAATSVAPTRTSTTSSPAVTSTTTTTYSRGGQSMTTSSSSSAVAPTSTTTYSHGGPSSTYTSAASPWEDVTTTTTSWKPVDPTSTGQPWQDVTTTSKPVDPASTWEDYTTSTTSSKPVDPAHTWEDVVSTTKPVDPAHTWSDSPIDPAHTWQDVVSTTKPVDPAHTWSDSPVDPAHTWEDVVSTTKPVDPAHPTWSDSPAPVDPAPTWSDSPAPADPQTWADSDSASTTWANVPLAGSQTASWTDYPAVPATTISVVPQPSKPVSPEQAGPSSSWVDAAAPSATGSKPVADYTGAASQSKIAYGAMALAALAGAMML